MSPSRHYTTERVGWCVRGETVRKAAMYVLSSLYRLGVLEGGNYSDRNVSSWCALTMGQSMGQALRWCGESVQ